MTAVFLWDFVSPNWLESDEQYSEHFYYQLGLDVSYAVGGAY